MPIVSASYDGGLIVTDWYSSGNSDESVKINISFTSNEVSASSIVVSSFKKICKNGQNCKTVKTDENFNKKIKDQILAEVREINSKIN
jgi:CxxC motif-containing protein